MPAATRKVPVFVVVADVGQPRFFPRREPAERFAVEIGQAPDRVDQVLMRANTLRKIKWACP